MRKFSEKFKNIWKYTFVGGSRGGAPDANEISKTLVEKSMENCKILKILNISIRIQGT